MTDLDRQSELLRQALRRLPAPPPRAGFVDHALAKAAMAHGKRARPSSQSIFGRSGLQRLLTRWEMWVGAGLGGAVAAALTLMLMRPVEPSLSDPPDIALALHEVRAVEVLIDSERDLQGATIRIAVSGSVALEGFDNEREMSWHANLERGNNLLSLPVVARAPGAGRLIATIEHAGRTRRVAIDLQVHHGEVSRI